MQIRVKDFAVTMNLGTRGITFDVYDTNGNHLGDIRNLSTRMRQRSWGFYEGSAAVAAAGASRRGVLAAA